MGPNTSPPPPVPFQQETGQQVSALASFSNCRNREPASQARCAHSSKQQSELDLGGFGNENMEAAGAKLMDFSQPMDVTLLDQVVTTAFDASHPQVRDSGLVEYVTFVLLRLVVVRLAGLFATGRGRKGYE